MPVSEEKARGGVVRYRTIRVGHGKDRKYVRVAIVRKAGTKGGKTITGQPQSYKEK